MAIETAINKVEVGGEWLERFLEPDEVADLSYQERLKAFEKKSGKSRPGCFRLRSVCENKTACDICVYWCGKYNKKANPRQKPLKNGKCAGWPTTKVDSVESLTRILGITD